MSPPDTKKIDRFLNTYKEVRRILLEFENEGFEGWQYASVYTIQIRDAFDDWSFALSENNEDKMANALEHLEIIGCDILEMILIDRIDHITFIMNKLNRWWRKLIYSRKTFNSIFKELPKIQAAFNDGRYNKSINYQTSTKKYKEGIQISDEIINKYEMEELPGMQVSIRREGYVISGFIGFILGIITGVIVGFLL